MDIKYLFVLWLNVLVSELELRNMLRREEDKMDAVIKINSGAGGTESMDWANMLFRMYQRYCQNHNYKFKVII